MFHGPISSFKIFLVQCIFTQTLNPRKNFRNLLYFPIKGAYQTTRWSVHLSFKCKQIRGFFRDEAHMILKTSV